MRPFIFETVWHGQKCAHLARCGTVLDFEDRFFRRLILETDLVANQGNALMLAVPVCVGRQYIEAHRGAFGTTKLSRHIVNTPTNDIGHRAVAALPDSCQTITDIEIG
jgi:hypothetical protein